MRFFLGFARPIVVDGVELVAGFHVGSIVHEYVLGGHEVAGALAHLGSVQQSRLSSQFAFQHCNLPQLRKMSHFISICIWIFNFDVFKMGIKWGMTVLLI